MPRTFARTAAVVVWSMLLTTAASDVPGYRGAGLLLRQGLTAVALQLCHLSPMTSFWSYPAEARLWLEVASCESSALGPCVLPPHFDPDLNDTSHSTIEVVQNEDLMVSWYMTAGNGSTRSFAQMFKTPCTGIQCASDDSSGDSSGCTATLIGRHSFVEDQCAGRGQENCTGSAMPCLWDAANELCGRFPGSCISCTCNIPHPLDYCCRTNNQRNCELLRSNRPEGSIRAWYTLVSAVRSSGVCCASSMCGGDRGEARYHRRKWNNGRRCHFC